ncbi:MAG: 16S rRNA (cytosine(1402)-N(4))-methyltransferase RsmH [Candidatus Berkelbacteria bacterium]
MNQHISVLLQQVVENFSYLKDLEKGYFVDGTLGAGGHSIEILKNINNPNIVLVGIDKDKKAISIARRNFKKADLPNKIIYVNKDFKEIAEISEKYKIKDICGCLLDLGVSSMQINTPDRGFSFQNPDEILDMRMDQESEFRASDILNGYSQEKIAEILYKYGEEPFARIIAKDIVQYREKKYIETVGQLLEILLKTLPRKYVATSQKHYATKVFQALRIETNKELDQLSETLKEYEKLLIKDGRLAVISFHSLEDRIVKETFRSIANPCKCPPKMPCNCGLTPTSQILTRKPMIADELEISTNPRSRSAKMRIIEKITDNV